MSLVGKKAQLFTSPGVVNGKVISDDFSLKNIIGRKEIVIFFCSIEYSLVCPTEILSFQVILPEFEKRNVAVIGISTDTQEDDVAVRFKPKMQRSIEEITFPLIADVDKTIASKYGVLGGDWNYDDNGKLVFNELQGIPRGMFFIDKDGIVRYEQINFFPEVKNIHNILRFIDAWRYKEGCVKNNLVSLEKERDGTDII